VATIGTISNPVTSSRAKTLALVLHFAAEFSYFLSSERITTRNLFGAEVAFHFA
jgi:hypothetical protein